MSYLNYLKAPETEAAAELRRKAVEREKAEAAQEAADAAKAAETAAECEIRASRVEEAGQLKDKLRECLDAGMPAPYLAMQAMRCIALLTGDMDYADHAAEVLRNTYQDIEQRSAFTLDAMRAEYELDLLVKDFCNVKAVKVDTIRRKAETIAEKARETSVMIESLRQTVDQ